MSRESDNPEKSATLCEVTEEAIPMADNSEAKLDVFAMYIVGMTF